MEAARTLAAGGLIVVASAWSGAALGEYKLSPYGSAQVEHSSNVFDLPDSQQGPGNQRSDTLWRFLAGVDTSFAWSAQKLRAKAEMRRVNFNRFTDLDHNEHLWNLGLDWKWSAADGAFDYSHERRMASFAERRSTELALETERIADGRGNLNFNPEWRLETLLRSRQLDAPLPGFPEFSIKEDSINAALKYIQVDTITAGGYAEYLSGRFEGVPAADRFHQESVGLSADYGVSDLARFAAQLGYTRRADAGNSAALSGLTGLLSYRRELTYKTTLGGQVFRRITSYAGGASGVRDTGFQLEAVWKATDKTSVSTAYQFTRSQFQQSREDDTHLATVKGAYQALEWLSLRPYWAYQSRDSSVEIDSFHTTIVGLELQARLSVVP